MRLPLITWLWVAAAVSAQQPHAFVWGNALSVAGAGETLTSGQAKQLASQIQKALLDRYASERGLEVTDLEYEKLRAKMPESPGSGTRAEELRRELLRSGQSERQAAEAVQRFQQRQAAQDRQFFGGLIQHWKVGRDIYARYGGGRLRLSAFGFHDPMDAMEKFLEEQEAQGVLRIPGSGNRAAVWKVFRDKQGGDGMVSGPRAAEIYASAPWETENGRRP